MVGRKEGGLGLNAIEKTGDIVICLDVLGAECKRGHCSGAIQHRE